MADKANFFTYKGLPLVRMGKQLYFGNMYDEFVIWMEILETKKEGDIDVATKVRIRKMATDVKLPPNEAIVKTKEVDSLFSALDYACAWLKVS
ncbi:MAG: hypothetical protein IJ740_04675 [Ruminococcus sp.]|nr:hypothetical protein [Ruminococcus sp.]